MLKKRTSKGAELKAILIYYDEPVLAHLVSNRGRDLIALSVDSTDNGFKFFVCEVTEKNFHAYMDSRIDLRFLFSQQRTNQYYFMYWNEKDGPFRLSNASIAEIANPENFPDAGLFAYMHTNLDYLTPPKNSRTTYSIQGTWEARDFSRFWSSIADLYSILSASEAMTGAEEPTFSKKISDIINDLPWQRGGSSASFYSQMKPVLRSEYPIRVAEIEYASPGHIALEGNSKVFNSINNMILIEDKEWFEAISQFEKLRKLLRDEKLLGASKDTAFSGDYAAQLARRYADGMLQALDFPHEPVWETANRDILIYSKVSMSIFRRYYNIKNFYEEGRITPNNS